MKTINWLGLLIFLVPNICFANPISVEIDFWDYTLEENWVDMDTTEYDGHIVLNGIANSDFTEFVFSDGTIGFGGNTFPLISGRFSFTDYSEFDWDYIITRTYGSYIDDLGVERIAWAHIEGVGAESFYSGETIDSEGHVLIVFDNHHYLWQDVRLTVVSESSIFALMFISLAMLLTSRKLKKSRYNI